MKKNQLMMAAVLFLILVISRLVPHPYNFTALSGVALFAGALWRGNILRYIVPLVSVFVTDMYFGFYPGMEWTYLGIAAGVLLAPQIQSSWFKVGVHSLLASTVFFLFSNLGVWWSSGLYTQDAQGLVQCYTLAIPFFHNTWVSGLFYSTLLFSVYRLAFYEKGLQGFVPMKINSEG